MTPNKRTKSVKAWFITFGRRTDVAFPLYRRKKDAIKTLEVYSLRETVKIVPCTITYTLPSPLKKKP